MSRRRPTGTVTVLSADHIASQRASRVFAEAVADHDGVQLPDPDVEPALTAVSVAAFARASDAVAAALRLGASAKLQVRIGIHTGEVHRCDAGEYAAPTLRVAARLRDLAGDGQVLISAATAALVQDRLPDAAWLSDVGAHPLANSARPERVVRLCHPELADEAPPRVASNPPMPRQLPVQTSSFVGRTTELAEVRCLLQTHRLVTLTGAGGVGKTRLAIEVAAQVADRFGDGVWFVNLAPIRDPGMVPMVMARALGLPDAPDSSTTTAILAKFIGERCALVILDNCEHLLDASASLIAALASAGGRSRVLTTSRQPLGAAGEVSWRVPSLALGDEAVELFSHRAAEARAGFTVTAEDAESLAEICRRLDGIPLALELAAARVRALSLAEILDTLHDRFRLITGSARAIVGRHQTLRASVDWSHELLTHLERILFRRLSVFHGGFDLGAVQAVASGTDLPRGEVLELLILLVDKSLVLADHGRRQTRYRLLETVRQYAAEKLGESGETNMLRERHRDHFTTLATVSPEPGHRDDERLIEWADAEIDNLRAAFTWSRETSDVESALRLASSLQPLWRGRGRADEGRAWFDAILEKGEDDPDRALSVRARALADKSVLTAYTSGHDSLAQAQQALAIARDLDDPALLANALTACGYNTAHQAQIAQPYFAEATAIARTMDDRRILARCLTVQAYGAVMAGDPKQAGIAAAEAGQLAEEIGDRVESRRCRTWLAWSMIMRGQLDQAAAQLREVRVEAEIAQDKMYVVLSLMGLAHALAYLGDDRAAGDAARDAVAAAAELGGLSESAAGVALAVAAIAAGDVETARDAADLVRQRIGSSGQGPINVVPIAQVAYLGGDLSAARWWADKAVATTAGWHRLQALATRAVVARSEGDFEQAGRDVDEALAYGAESEAMVGIAHVLECKAECSAEDGNYRDATRMFAAAHALRRRIGENSFPLRRADHESFLAEIRTSMGKLDFDAAWAAGANSPIAEVISYTLRGRGGRKRPTMGWASLTRTEREVVRLVNEGLANNDIAGRMFISPRTVQTHLTHVYAKLGLASRAQLIRETARRDG
ncbi:helix-turn-helix transcriptional regulator [Mycobacterium camsae]|uniref:helix-turn-helix transcriptional regulator n=1 Tax=Mycobacterium gordonae TaxID=1778 RepID=UPI00197D48D9|nr:LuxR C-terminal-related transcriptional regulator [Mycobacterium gordonae]